jgi:phenylalanyl-tRNA synthetase beta chain
LRILLSWLRDFVDVNVSADELAEALTTHGFEVSAVEPVSTLVADGQPDAVLDLEITTNRPDCLNVLGIAREVSTIYDSELRDSVINVSEELVNNAGDDTSNLAVSIESQDLCRRYTGAVVDVTVGPSPSWLAARLSAAGVRPVNNIVDITNYVMIEMGHPMHAFDLKSIKDGIIKVRLVKNDEVIRTLDGQERRLSPDILVIADSTRPHAIAGIMGGADSEVSSSSRSVVLESAYFQPASIRRTSKRLSLSTEASYRFERGSDIEAPVAAMRRALTLFHETRAGQLRGSVVDNYPQPHSSKEPIVLRHTRISQILGVTISSTFVEATLKRLNFTLEPASVNQKVDDSVEAAQVGPTWHVVAPTRRVDVSQEIDLIEEVARHYGYDRLSSTFPPVIQAPAQLSSWHKQQRLLRQVLSAGGCSEAMTYSFTDRAAGIPFVDNKNDLVDIANPLSEKYTILRPSLIPGLLDALIHNRRRERRDIRLFEIGKRFRQSTGETAGVAIIITGAGTVNHWSTQDRFVDLFDIKGIVERLCDALGVAPRFKSIDNSILVPGRAAQVSVLSPGTTTPVSLGLLGQLTPSLAATRGLPESVEEIYVAELDLRVITSVAIDRGQLQAASVPRHPSVIRDLAVIVADSLPAATVRETIDSAAPETLVNIREFDRYRGKGFPDGCVSLGLRLTFRAADRTLTDEEVQSAIDNVITALKKHHDATLR